MIKSGGPQTVAAPRIVLADFRCLLLSVVIGATAVMIRIEDAKEKPLPVLRAEGRIPASGG
ncbi:MAG TPA: hypothetical protein VMI47_10215 [Pseudolabrys sp.]|nr:hypothetical protein [Pseudolabrys sp.]